MPASAAIVSAVNAVLETAVTLQRRRGEGDARGAWVEKGRLRHHDVEPEGGVIDSRTFVRNVRVLCEVVKASQ